MYSTTPTSEPFPELLTDDPYGFTQHPPPSAPIHDHPNTPPAFSTAERIQRVLSIQEGEGRAVDALLADLPAKTFLTTAEAAQALGVSRVTIWRLAKRRRLRPLPVDGPHSAFRVEDVLNLLPGQPGPDPKSENN